MVKGYKGESCPDAIRNSMIPDEILSFTDLFDRVKRKGQWKEITIWRYFMACVVNLPPARHEWPNTRPFLFLHGDGTYELYNPNKHPSNQYRG
ncbi:MAG: hypothetical protein A2W35_09510 [Chloroflexi bacterium RBG_16_57_11]|nr:MAG: hypothetical protein A2W35_09510 [Chloroflexi bacterium RBG_16_57_11]